MCLLHYVCGAGIMSRKCFLRHEPSFFCASLVLSDLINMAAARGAQIQSKKKKKKKKERKHFCNLQAEIFVRFLRFRSVASSLGVVIVAAAAAAAVSAVVILAFLG